MPGETFVSTLAGLSALPLTPMGASDIDEAAFAELVTRLAEAGVDSIGAFGSTGHYEELLLSRTKEGRSCAR